MVRQTIAEPQLAFCEELLQSIEARTNRQVRDLRIDCEESRVRVTGRSPTFYLKQLVTQAVLTAAPRVRLENEVLVCQG